LIAE
jgi:hypothetical protein